MSKIVFWDVDTQVDFMRSHGKLYVPDAEAIIDNLARLTHYARERSIRVLGSADDHRPDDPELSNSPDYRETYPPHCLHGTEGQRKILETAPRDPLWIGSAPLDRAELERRVRVHGGEIYFLKQRFDVFTNPNVDAVLELLSSGGIVVYGVALDVCDRFAIEGFLAQGRGPITLVEDATKPIVAEEAEKLVSDWRRRGVRVVSTADIVEREALATAA